MRLRWTPSAADDLERIYSHVAEQWPSLTTATMRLLYDSVRSLRSFPGRGRPGVRSGTRELVLGRLPYVIVYRLAADIVEVLRIYHSAQDRRF